MGLKIKVDNSRMAPLELMMNRLQSMPMMRAAMAKGLNEHLQRQATNSVTTVAAQTGLPSGMIKSGTSVQPASAASLTGAVRMQGKAVLAGQYTSRSWSKANAGARHADWPTYTRKGGMMAHTFMAYGKIMKREKGAKRGPLHAVMGPVFPNEMLRTDMPNWKRAEGDVTTDLQVRVMRAVTAALGF